MNPPGPSLGVRIRKLVESPSAAAVYTSVRIEQEGTGIPALTQFYPSITSTSNFVLGTIHRIGREMPSGDTNVRFDFMQFSKELILTLFPHKLRSEDVPLDQVYLEHLNQTASRIRSLRGTREKIEFFESNFSKIKAFVKNEGWPEPKAARIICSPCDESKVILGPVCHAADLRTFGLDARSENGQRNPGSQFFVKGTDPRDWPEKLRLLFGQDLVRGTDFTSMEAHHRDEFAEIGLFWLLHMMHDLPELKEIRVFLAKLVVGRREIQNKNVTVEMLGTLMSGALWTSSMNAILNLCIMMYLKLRTKYPLLQAKELSKRWPEVKVLCEGDDGLIEAFEPAPGLCSAMGILLKFEPAVPFNQSGFCRIFCDSSSLTVVKNPIDVMRKFFALPARYEKLRDTKLKSLLRARALSYLFNFGQCPVVASLCHWVLRRTRSIHVALDDEPDWWARRTLAKALREKPWMARKAVPDTSRQMVADIFGLPIESQLDLEKIFDFSNEDVLQMDLSMYWATPKVPLSTCLKHAQQFVQVRSSEYNMPSYVFSKDLAKVLRHGIKPLLTHTCESRLVETDWKATRRACPFIKHPGL